jgi:hypothetical protein
MVVSEATDAADRAADAVRVLNHATTGRKDLSIAEVYEIVGSLGELCQRLPQAFNQLAVVLEAHLAAGRPGVDDMGPYRNASSAVSAAKAALSAAAGAAGPIDGAVHEAHEAVARLKTVEPHLRAVPGEQPSHLRRPGPAPGTSPRL